jgi:peroxiredoxin
MRLSWQRKHFGSLITTALLVALICGFTSAALAARTSSGEDCILGKQAPPFLLPILGEETFVESDTLFESAAITLLAFWTTHCTECSHRMEACQELYDWGYDDGFNVVGINFDETTSSKMRSVALGAAPRVMHLYDVGGRVSADYKAGNHSFSAILVDEFGKVLAVHHDVMPDKFRAMKPELTRLLNEAYGDDPLDPAEPVVQADRTNSLLTEFSSRRDSKIELHARGRLRWMNIDTTGVGAVGSNNEPLTPGSSLRHRIDLEVSYHISPSLEAGGLIRLSNEGAGVLRSGPDYLSNGRGSIFIRHKTKWQLPLLGRVQSNFVGGFYQIALTPLTLMRWDQSDTPISGGQGSSSCGCGGSAGSAGFIRSESLEQLGPDLGFEGARWDLTINDQFDFLALYARPQTPNPSDNTLCGELPETESFYHQDLYAARLGSSFGLSWTPEPLELAVTTVIVREDEKQPACAPEDMDHNPYNNILLAADMTIPMPARFSLYGELAYSDWTSNKLRKPVNNEDGIALQLTAAKEIRLSTDKTIAGIYFENLTGHLEVAYQRVESSFFSPYGALSLESNRQGPRVSGRFDWGPVGLGFFYKRLEKIAVRIYTGYPEHGDGNENLHTTWSAWLDAALWNGGVAMIGTVVESKSMYEDLGTNFEMGPQERTSLILNLKQELAPKCSIMAEAELLDGQWQEQLSASPASGAIRDYETQVARLMMEIEF